jgi:hypothetical protein
MYQDKNPRKRDEGHINPGVMEHWSIGIRKRKTFFLLVPSLLYSITPILQSSVKEV